VNGSGLGLGRDAAEGETTTGDFVEDDDGLPDLGVGENGVNFRFWEIADDCRELPQAIFGTKYCEVWLVGQPDEEFADAFGASVQSCRELDPERDQVELAVENHPKNVESLFERVVLDGPRRLDDGDDGILDGGLGVTAGRRKQGSEAG